MINTQRNNQRQHNNQRHEVLEEPDASSSRVLSRKSEGVKNALAGDASSSKSTKGKVVGEQTSNMPFNAANNIVEAAAARLRNKRFQSSSSVIFSHSPETTEALPSKHQSNSVNINRRNHQQHRNSHHFELEDHHNDIPASTVPSLMSQSTTTIEDVLPKESCLEDQMSVSCTAADFTPKNSTDSKTNVTESKKKATDSMTQTIDSMNADFKTQTKELKNKTKESSTQCSQTETSDASTSAVEQHPDPKTASSIFGVEGNKPHQKGKKPANLRSQSVSDAVVDVSPKPPATAFTISFDDDNETEADKKLSLTDSLHKFAPKKRIFSFERGVKERRSTRSASAAPVTTLEEHSGPDSLESTTMNSLPLTDSAAYLINKMLFSEPHSPTIDHTVNRQNEDDDDLTPTDVSVNRVVKEKTVVPSTPAKEEHVDTLSEAGTYTLEVDDPRRTFDVEEARKMIDNVFGVARNQECYGNLRNLGSSVPTTPKPTRRPAVRQTRRSGTEDSNCSGSVESDLKTRTFTRSKSGRRPSVEDCPSSPTFDTSTFDQVYNSRHQKASPSKRASSNLPRSSPRLPVRNRLDSFSSSKSGGSNKTVEVKKPIVHAVKGSPVFQRKRLPSSSGLTRGSSDSLPGSDADSDIRPRSEVSPNPASSSSGPKINRAFALKRAMLGLDTPGLNITLTDEKVQKNLEKRAADPRNMLDLTKSSSSNFARDDGGRFSLRVSSRKPPTCPSTPTRKPKNQRVSSGKVESLKLSPASSTTSIPSYQRSSSFGPNQLQSNGLVVHQQSYRSPSGNQSSSRTENSAERIMRGMSSFSKRMFSTKPHYQSQQPSSSSSRQQANVAPIKRQQENIHSQQQQQNAMTSSGMSSSLHEVSPEANRPSTSTTSPPTSSPGRRTLSSLDNLVVSAILQLSVKIRRGMREWLEQEKLKHPSGSETRLMIEEILPQVSSLDVSGSFDALSGGNENLSKDLSNILKNLKKVEQSMEGELSKYVCFCIVS